MVVRAGEEGEEDAVDTEGWAYGTFIEFLGVEGPGEGTGGRGLAL